MIFSKPIEFEEPFGSSLLQGLMTRRVCPGLEEMKKVSEGFLQFENLFSDLLHGFFLKGFLPLLGIVAAPGVKTPDEPDGILRSKGIDQGIVPLALDLGNCLFHHR